MKFGSLCALDNRSGEAVGERMAAHSEQGLLGECHRLKEHALGKLWSSNSHQAKVVTEKGGSPAALRWRDISGRR
jgi:hypothetical protein